jgi:hypothetical protein
MNEKLKKTKSETLIFRAPKIIADSVDAVAKMLGTNRSEALRRLIPDLSKPAEQKGTYDR